MHRWGRVGTRRGVVPTVPALVALVAVVATVVSGGTVVSGAAAARQAVAYEAVGYLDAAELVAGGMRVVGWAYSVADDPATVEVVVDGAVVATGAADGRRPDLASLFDGSELHGVDLVVPRPADGLHEVCLRARAPGDAASFSRHLGPCRQVVVGGGSPRGWLDRVEVVGVGLVRVVGWALDPDTLTPAAVRVTVNGQVALIVSADAPRPDVGAAFPGWGHLRGVDETLGPLAPGAYQVCVTVLDTGEGDDLGLGCRTVVVRSGSPQGHLDRIGVTGEPGEVVVEGWAVDPDLGVGPVDIHVYADGRFVAGASTSVARPDVVAAVPGAGPHPGFSVRFGGFGWSTPRVCVYALNVGAGATLSLGCRSVAVTASAPTARTGELVIQGAGDVAVDPAYIPDLARRGYGHALSGLGGLFAEDDLTIVNLECAAGVGGARVPKNFNFRCDPAALPVLARDGVDVVSQANNHSLDYGRFALADAIERIPSSGLHEIGIGVDANDAAVPLLLERDGWKVAVLGYSPFVEFDWNYAGPSWVGIAPSRTLADLTAGVEAVADHADVVVVVLHWGRENRLAPDVWQEQWARSLIDAGADVVMGHHSHRLQRMEYHNGGVIFYSLGNFVWPDLGPAASDTAVARVQVATSGAISACLLPATIVDHGHPALDQPARRTC